jgi:hypothetical protein
VNPQQIRDRFLADGFAGPFELSDKTIVARLVALFQQRGYDGLWSKRNQHVLFPEVAAAGTSSEILGRVEPILGQDLLLWLGHLLPRRAEGDDSKANACHIDGLNLKFGGVHVSLAVTDMTRANGCLWLIPGSNRWSTLRRFAAIGLANSTLAMRRWLMRKLFRPLELKSGQFFLMHGGTVHIVLPNNTEQTRLGLVLRYCKPSTRAHNAPKPLRKAFNRRYSPSVDDNEADLVPCLLARGQDTHQLNDLRKVPQADSA